MLKSVTHRRARRAAGYAIVLLGLAFLFPQVASAQCAMCRRALQSPEGQQMIAAFRSGILFLLVTPFAVFATIALLAVRAQRRRAVAQNEPTAVSLQLSARPTAESYPLPQIIAIQTRGR